MDCVVVFLHLARLFYSFLIKKKILITIHWIDPLIPNVPWIKLCSWKTAVWENTPNMHRYKTVCKWSQRSVHRRHRALTRTLLGAWKILPYVLSSTCCGHTPCSTACGHVCWPHFPAHLCPAPQPTLIHSTDHRYCLWVACANIIRDTVGESRAGGGGRG